MHARNDSPVEPCVFAAAASRDSGDTIAAEAMPAFARNVRRVHVPDNFADISDRRMNLLVASRFGDSSS